MEHFGQVERNVTTGVEGIIPRQSMGKCDPSAILAKFKADHIYFIPVMCSVASESIIQGNEEEENWQKHGYLTALTGVMQKMMIPHCKKINYEGLLALS